MAAESTVYLPAPLVPAHVDITGMDYMPLSIERLISSDLYIKSTGEEFKAAFTLWCASWKQSPPGSIPNEEKLLKFLSCAGTKWKRVRDVALHGFVLCNDNRYYHPVIADMVMTAWEGRQKLMKKQAHTRARNQIWRANKARQLGRNDASVTRHETLSEASHDACVTQERRVCDASRDADVTPYKYKCKCKDKGKDLNTDVPHDESRGTAEDAIPTRLAQENADQEPSVNGDLWGDNPDASPRPPKKSSAKKKTVLVDTSPVVMEMPLFDNTMFPVTEAMRARYVAAYPSLDIDQCLRSAKVWLETNPSRRKTPGGMGRFLTHWIMADQNKGRNLRIGPARGNGHASPNAQANLYETNRLAGDVAVQAMQKIFGEDDGQK